MEQLKELLLKELSNLNEEIDIDKFVNTLGTYKKSEQ